MQHWQVLDKLNKVRNYFFLQLVIVVFVLEKLYSKQQWIDCTNTTVCSDNNSVSEDTQPSTIVRNYILNVAAFWYWCASFLHMQLIQQD